MKRKIDLHTHILPAMDDGARDAAQSAMLLEDLAAQGVSEVFATPHFYSHRESLQDFLARRTAALAALPAGAVQPAAEVYLTPFLFNNDDVSALCYPDTRVMLVEMPYNTDYGTDAPLRELVRLQQNFSVRPLLAHIERYSSLLSHPQMLRQLRSEGCLFQVNACSFLEKAWLKKLLALADQGYIDALGSDCHHPILRPAIYDEGLDVLRAHIGDAAETLAAADAVFPPAAKQDDFPFLLFP